MPISWFVLAVFAIVLLAPYAGCNILTSPPADPMGVTEEIRSQSSERLRPTGSTAGKLNDLDLLLGEK